MAAAPTRPISRLQRPIRQVAGRRLHPLRAVVSGLTATETAALEAFKSSNKTAAETVKLLQEAATTSSVPAATVEGALVHLGALVEPIKGPQIFPGGRWRLVFSTKSSIRFLQYIPVKEDFVIDEATKRIALESVVGPFNFYITGSYTKWEPAAGALQFQFNQVEATLLGSTLFTTQPQTKPKTYTFYYVNREEGLAVAKSSAGGRSLLRFENYEMTRR